MWECIFPPSATPPVLNPDNEGAVFKQPPPPPFTLQCVYPSLPLCSAARGLQRVGFYVFICSPLHFALACLGVARELAAEETKVAAHLNSLSELQRGAGITEQMDKQTWLPEVLEWQGRGARLSGSLRNSLIWGEEPEHSTQKSFKC